MVRQFLKSDPLNRPKNWEMPDDTDRRQRTADVWELPRYEWVRQTAYEKWEVAGRPEGQSDRFWSEAEREYSERLLIRPHVAHAAPPVPAAQRVWHVVQSQLKFHSTWMQSFLW